MTTSPSPTENFLSGGGAMAELILSRDWSQTALGPIEHWPQSLRTTVSLCLASNVPINIIWGPEHRQIYNDRYRVLCGEAHPRALGEPYARNWASAWLAMGAPFDRALAGETSFLENQRMVLFRNGCLEETFFTVSLSPIRDETGGIGGLFQLATETTDSMVSARRTRLLRDLNAALAETRSAAEVYAQTLKVLAGGAFDLPFVLVYAPAEDGDYHLAGVSGITVGSAAAPETLALEASTPWPAGRLAAGGEAVLVETPAELFDGESCGPYDEPPSKSLAFPISLPGSQAPAALLIAGVSARLPLTNSYRDFLSLLASAITAGLANAKTHEEERQRHEAADPAVLRQTEQQLEFALNAGRLGSFEFELGSRAFSGSDYTRSLLGIGPDESFESLDDVVGRVHPEDVERRQAAVDKAVRDGTDLDIEYRILRGANETAWLLVRGRAVYTTGKPVRMVGVCMDITARKHAEEHQKLLLDELNHRVKNTLATVQSITMQARRNNDLPEIFSETFVARIRALARGHDLLIETSWESASLHEVIRRTVTHVLGAESPDRVIITGPEINLGPNAAVTLNMAFHELATNAIKYGALSTPNGRVEVTWTIADGFVVLDWRESGGPTVGVPKRRGFGSRLIEQGVAREMQGSARFNFEPSGFSCHMRLSLAAKLRLRG